MLGTPAERAGSLTGRGQLGHSSLMSVLRYADAPRLPCAGQQAARPQAGPGLTADMLVCTQKENQSVSRVPTGGPHERVQLLGEAQESQRADTALPRVRSGCCGGRPTSQPTDPDLQHRRAVCWGVPCSVRAWLGSSAKAQHAEQEVAALAGGVHDGGRGQLAAARAAEADRLHGGRGGAVRGGAVPAGAEHRARGLPGCQ